MATDPETEYGTVPTADESRGPRGVPLWATGYGRMVRETDPDARPWRPANTARTS